MITISVTDAMQLYDCRIALETLAVKGACENANWLQLQTLEKYILLAEKVLECQPSESNNFQLINLEYQFHLLIAESSGNKYLVGLLERVFDQMALMWFQTTHHNQALVNWIEHRQIYEAIATRNVTSATESLKLHLTSSKARVIQKLQKFQPQDE